MEKKIGSKLKFIKNNFLLQNIKYNNYYPSDLFVCTRNFFIPQKVDKIVEQKMFECGIIMVIIWHKKIHALSKILFKYPLQGH